MRLHDPWALSLLLCAVLAAWGWRRWRSRATVRFSSLAILAPAPTWRQRAMPLLKVLRLIAIGAIVLGIARPQTGVGRTRVSTEGVALMMALDRSGSMGERMAYEGREMSRLDVVKRVFEDFVEGDGKALEGRREDLIGIVAFARYADTVCPLVRDPDALVAVTDRLQVAVGHMDGTAIGDGVALAAARLRRAEVDLDARAKRAAGENPSGEAKPDFLIRSKAIILLTDGRQTAGEISAEQAAALAKEWGIRIYAIGIGASTVQTAFGELPVPGGGADMLTLQRVAEITGGRAWLASNADALREVVEEINQLEKSKIESLEYTDYEENFALLAQIALGALLAEAALGATLLRRAPA
mgnify:CR=1 FL=1